MTKHTAMDQENRAAVSGGPLHLESVTKTYGSLRAADSVDLIVPEGSFLSLLGPSGSGKTTLLMMVAGFVTPDSGRVMFDGRDISLEPPERRNFGMVFQGYALFPHMTVAQNVAFPLKLRGHGQAEITARVGQALGMMQLGKLAERYPSQLSGGQQQRVALARSLVFRPKVMLLDEPLSALDRKLRTELQWELRSLHQQVGSTFLYVTHDQEEALSMSTEIAIVNNGRIVQRGTPQELYQKPRSHFVASFLGRINILEGRVVEVGAGRCCLEAGEARFSVTGASGAAVGQNMLVAIRTERMQLLDAKPGNGNALRGTIANWSFVGPIFQFRIDTALGPMEAIQSVEQGAAKARIGAEVWLNWADDAGVVIEDDRKPGETMNAENGRS